MIEPPRYFDGIRKRTDKRWEQLESDPELAGPWHQLFKQVQSPRHILSELLQNADDAGATEAAVRIEDHCFVFTHNGEDFTEEHFASLCRFGYSNKRALHTIGFRGIGFKSTFSLGDTVCLRTPTLSVAFERRRFTAPRWVNGSFSTPDCTEVRVPITDVHREKEVTKNLLEWRQSPVSLLFFKHVRCLRIGEQEMRWVSMGPGPVPDSEWVALHDKLGDAFLLIRSVPEAFPNDALAEIRQERLLSIDEETDFPPSKVEIVLGAKGRLYVVLPTGVETALPFACNAPFIQDPARLKIKDPETSPTNRWLLSRIGVLTASVMLQWLENTSATLVERSRAYGLFPDTNSDDDDDYDYDDNSLEGTCAATVKAAFDRQLQGQKVLLTNDGELRPAKQSVVVPEEMFDIWRVEEVAFLLDGGDRPPFSRHVPVADCEKLVRRGIVGCMTKDDVLEVLLSKHLPKPQTWQRLLKLWAYVAPDVTDWLQTTTRSAFRIVPAQGKNVLYAAAEVVRLGEKRLLQSDADWEFLSDHLLVLNQNWPRFIAEQRRAAGDAKNQDLDREAAAALAVLKALGLEETSDASKVLSRVAVNFFARESVSLADSVQLAQIAAKLGAAANDSFRFVTRDRRLRSIQHSVLFDPDGSLEKLLPKNWCTEHLLHSDYVKEFVSCSAEEWRRWVSSGRSGLLEFPPITEKRTHLYSRPAAEAELRKRGCSSLPSYPYKTSDFVIEDWDFDDAFWRHWTAISTDDDGIWGHLLDRILAQPESFWSVADKARALQIATTGNTRAITYLPLLPTWILKFCNLPCLPDTRGIYRKPTDLLRRTPETEPLMDVEFFVHRLLDRENVRSLLTSLGVRDTPTGPGRLLDCLRALAQSDKPPVHEVDKWYRRLDQMIDTCSTLDVLAIKKAFREEKIILTEGMGWTKSSGVFLSSNEEEVPGTEVIRAAVRDLALWRKVDVSERPSLELAIAWLKELPSGNQLSPDDARRVRALLARHAVSTWFSCGHWLNLAREWVPVTSLKYAVTMQTLVEYSHLHEGVKQKTADLQRLPVEVTETQPFCGLSRLASCIEERFRQNPLFPATPEEHPWLNRLGAELRRIQLDDATETGRIQGLSQRLQKTAWQSTEAIEIIPYIDGTPVGMPKRTEVVWLDENLFVENLPNARLARLVPERLSKIFGRPEISAALSYCFGRSVDEVTEYVEGNFTLAPPPPTATAENDARDTFPPEPEEQTSAANTVPGQGTDDARNIEIAAPSEPPTAHAESDELLDAAQSVLDGIDIDVVPTRDRHPQKPAKPSMIERFARSHGFQKDSDERYFHTDGSWIGRAVDQRFPWERRTAKGDLVRYYWPKEHCLDREPLELEADIWALIDDYPETYALLLLDSRGDAVEVSGATLRKMREREELTLFPASYRLVVDHDRKR